MSFRAALQPLRRAATRRLSTSPAAEAMDKAATKGPKLPLGNDPAAYHGPEHAVADTNRWRMISMLFSLPVAGFFVVSLMTEHKHVEAPPEYPYLKMASRVSFIHCCFASLKEMIFRDLTFGVLTT